MRKARAFATFGSCLFLTCLPLLAQTKEYRQNQIIIRPCESIADPTRRQLCMRERELKLTKKVLATLAAGPNGPVAAGPAEDCAALAESECNNHLNTVDTLSFENGVCIWTCKAFAAGPVPDSEPSQMTIADFFSLAPADQELKCVGGGGAGVTCTSKFKFKCPKGWSPCPLEGGNQTCCKKD